MGDQHAVHDRSRRQHPHRTVRNVQRRQVEDGVPQRPESSLRPAHADDQRHPLQLLGARDAMARHCREPEPGTGPRLHDPRLLRTDPQLPALLLAPGLPLRRLTGCVQVVHPQHRLRLGPVRRGLALPPPRHLAQDGAPRLPKRCAVVPAHLLQQPGRVRRHDVRRADRTLPALRGRRRQGRKRLSTALDIVAADRERVLRRDPPEATNAIRGAAARGAIRTWGGVRGGPVPRPQSIPKPRHRCRHLPFPGRFPAPVPAHG